MDAHLTNIILVFPLGVGYIGKENYQVEKQLKLQYMEFQLKEKTQARMDFITN